MAGLQGRQPLGNRGKEEWDEELWTGVPGGGQRLDCKKKSNNNDNDEMKNTYMILNYVSISKNKSRQTDR